MSPNVNWFIAFIFALTSSLSPTVLADDFFDETFGNLQEDLETAQEDGKLGVFIFFHMEECPFCHRMKSTIMNQPKVIEHFRQHFLNFSIDIEGSNQMVNFDGTEGTAQFLAEKHYRVRATPVMMIFDLNGKPILKYTGPTRTEQEFMWLADYVIEQAYQKTSFTRYKRAKKQALANP